MKINNRKLAYICSPYSGDVVTNIRNAQQYCRMVYDKGYLPLAPHLYLPQFMSDETECEDAMKIDLSLVEICEKIFICGDKISNGMKAEIELAEALGIEIEKINI